MISREDLDIDSTNKIAIIGMSCRFPFCDAIDEFWDVLKSSKDCIINFPDTRAEELKKILPNISCDKFIKEGYLSEITLFEPEIFSISQEEAKYIDPQQRLLLELVEEAILSSGYNPKVISGEETGVFVSRNENEYSTFFNNTNTFSMVNNVEASNAGRVSYTYDFQGPTMSMDAACSSALVAIHLACQSLRTREINYAIAGGCKLRIVPNVEEDLCKSPIASKHEKIKSFDDDADGIIGGEGGGILVLKRLDKALEDNDNIIALISSSCVSTNGDKSSGINAPSEDSQKNMILKAIKNSKINPECINYIEAHGSGTRLGDIMEFQAIDKVFKEINLMNNRVAIGSVKTNLGHLDTAAGMAGIIKVILALKNKEIPPSINFKTLNKEIVAPDTSLYVVDKLTPWNTMSLRAAGVSSLSFVGINAHIILEEYDNRNYNSESTKMGELIVLSARTKKSLEKVIDKLCKHDGDEKVRFCDIAFTLNTGRRELPHKCIISANSFTEFKDKLKNKDFCLSSESNENKLKKVIVIPDINYCDLSDIDKFKGENIVYRNIYDEIVKDLNIEFEKDDGMIQYFLAMVSYVDMIKKYLDAKLVFMGMNTGNAIIDYINNKLTFSQCVSQIRELSEKCEDIDKERLQMILNNINKNSESLFLLIEPNQYLYNIFNNMKQGSKNVNLIYLKGKLDSFFYGLTRLIAGGNKIKWSEVYEGRNLRRVQLPSYEFDKKSYFLSSQDYRLNNSQDKILLKEDLNKNNLDEDIIEILRTVYNGEDFHTENKFYDLGLSSLSIMYVIGKVKEKYEIELPIEMFFEDITINEMCVNIAKVISDKNSVNEVSNTIKEKYYVASAAQKRIYASCQYDKNSTNYNMTFVFEIEGDLNLDKLNKSINKLIERHEALKVNFKMEDGLLYGIINEWSNIEVENIKTSNEDVNIVLKDAIKPFDLSKDLLLRVLNIETKTKKILVFDIHHIISDGLSMEILIKDFINIYEDKELSKIKYQYSDYANWEKEFYGTKEFKNQENFWINQFKDDFTQLKLPLDFERSSLINYKGDTILFDLEDKESIEVAAICERYKITPYILFLAVYNVLLAKFSLKEDITVGVFVNDRYKWGYEDIIGLFVNTLPMRSKPELNKQFSQYIEETKETFLKIISNQNYPIEKLIEKLKLPKNNEINPIFSVAFNYQNSAFDLSNRTLIIDGTKFKPYNYFDNYTKFDLLFEVIEINKDFSFKITYCNDLLKLETVNLLKECYKKILFTVLNDFDTKIIDIQLKDEDEKTDFIDDVNEFSFD